MQKTALLLLSAILMTSCVAQKTEVCLSLNSGLFSFRGRSAESTTFINYDPRDNSGYTNNPYGSKNGLCYGVSAQLQRVSKTNFIIGLDAGYERLRSKILINSISAYTGRSTFEYSAAGRTFLSYDFVNLFPYLGQRLMVNKFSFTLTAGPEIGFCLKATEHGKATATNSTDYTTSADRTTIKKDFRPRIQLSAHYKKAGVYIGYSYGWANYKSGYIGGVNECFARLLRFGTTYQIK